MASGNKIFFDGYPEPVTVTQLKSVVFSTLSLEEKISVKERGIPKPDLLITQEGNSNGKKYKRRFNRAAYDKEWWLCGCPDRNALFCWPCLMFSKGSRNKFSNDGFQKLQTLTGSLKEHKKINAHLDSVSNYEHLGESNIEASCSNAYPYKAAIESHNKKVGENLEILEELVKALFFCGKYELAVRGHNESEGSENQGIFRGLLDHVAENNPRLKDNLKNNKVFKGTSGEIQNDMLDSVVQVYRKQIISEIEQTRFVS